MKIIGYITSIVAHWVRLIQLLQGSAKREKLKSHGYTEKYDIFISY